MKARVLPLSIVVVALTACAEEQTNTATTVAAVEPAQVAEAPAAVSPVAGETDSAGRQAQAADMPAADVQLPADWSEFDADGDFYVTGTEFSELVPSVPFSAADGNGDGTFSRVEFQELAEKIAAGETLVAAGATKEEEIEAAADFPDKPLDVVNRVAKGELVNPYSPSNIQVVERGHELFFETGCNGCHGGTGGGGMGPPLSNKRWVYGNEPDTLFRLITLGSTELQNRGYSRIAREKVVGPMPAQHMILTTEGDLWKIINWILSLHLPEGEATT